MKRRRHISLLLLAGLLLLGEWQVFAQNITNRGRDFWVGYGHHQFMEPGQTNGQEMVLYFSAEQTANVRVTVNGRTAQQVTNYVVPAGTVIASNFMPKAGPTDCRLYDVPPSFGGNGGEGLYGMSVHIESDVPIVAYAHIFGSFSSGATMLMPVESWGYSFMSINSQQIDAGGPGFSWVYVIAQHDNTVIRVTPSVTTRLGKPAGVPFDITMQRGQIYQFIGQSDAGGNGNQFTGSTVKSIANAAGDCYPIAVFSGSSRTKGESVPCGTNSGRDNDMQQCFPMQAWGKRYLTAPFSAASGPNTNVNLTASTLQTSVYKVAVKDPTTPVRRNGVPLTGLINNTYYQFSSNTADLIESDKPIMIAQFMSGGSGCNPGTWGDPEMVFLSPVEQAIKRVGFYRNTRQAIYANYVTVIIPTNGVASLRIDGTSTFNHTYPHPNLPGYTVVVKGWQAAQAQTIMYSDSAFTAITYGLGSAESYAYNAGTYLNNLNAVSSIQNIPDPATPQHPFSCVGTPVRLSVLMAYQPTRIDWLLSQLGTALTPNADITDNSPVSTGTVVVNGVTYFKYTLPGNYVFNTADTFFLPINGYHPSIENCYNRENFQVPVIIKPTPQAAFNFTHSGCTLDPVTFTGTSALPNGYTASTFNWTFPGPATATGASQVRNLPPGVHNINLSVVTTDGCADDTTRSITIFDKPPGLFAVAPNSLCVGQSFTITDTSSAAIAVNNWWWDFGNGITQTVTTGPSVTYTYPLPGTYTIRHVASSTAACISDTISRTVTVYAKPVLSFTNNAAGCLAPSGTVQFTGTASTPDGQAISTYNWNFGDPNATVPNPNTSTLQNPSHNYQQGTYAITFSATTANGCTKDSIQTVTFNLKPALSFAALNAVCENAAPVSVASGAVTNGLTGTGTYRGPGTDAAGMFNPALAGFGTHTIWYIFTSGAGCRDSISQTIQVHARPRTGFSIPSSGCLPASGQVQFTNTSTIPDAQTMSWQWNFNDPNANAGNPNTSTAQNPTHNYGEGTYTINLQATSSNGCVKDTSISATFAVTPLINFAALPAICENAAPVSVATASVTNGIAGTGVYSGPGTNAAGQFNPTAAGFGTHTITYTYTTTGGCTQNSTQTILVHARPRTNFSIPSSGCLSPNGQVQFTNTSTIPDAQTMSWLWNFNDPNAGAGNPNTSTLLNPTHNYQEGTYTINLQATSSNGCVKDTSITAAFTLTPALNFPALTNVCQNPGASPSSIASASVTNGVNGTGVYSGPGTNAAGLFDPNLAGPGVHTITYTYTGTGGCVATASSTIEVYARPTASFTQNGGAGVCLGQAVTLNSTSTIPAGTISTWNWDFGNSTSASNNNGNPVNVNYTVPGTYTVRLVNVSDRGCFSLPVTQNVTVRPLPVADFSLPAGICMPGGMAGFINSSTISDNSGLTYNWTFGDGGTSANTNPSHPYASIGSYPVTLISTSASGCADTIVKTLNATAFVNKPTAAFTVSPQQLCQGQQNRFTDNSTAPGSNIQTWNWNFNDGSTSTNPSPTKTYSNAGTYNVSLTVTNAAGCVSDPVINTVTVHLQPVIDAGPSYTLPFGTQVTLQATANASTGLVFSWSPATGLSNPAILNPTLTGNTDQVYTLTATNSFGCTASDVLTIKILKPVKVPNVFTPNGDGIHDQWVIDNLGDYPGATVEVFNRYGQQVFYSPGYPTAWNGMHNGKPVPAGAYYYVIQLQNGYKPLTGSLTILR